MMFLDAVSVILDAIPRMFNIIWSIICAPIYYLISLFYNVFVMIPQINLLNDLKIEDIYQRVTMIIVIVMAFYITFEVVKYVVQPDTITDKEKGSGKLVLRIVFVILLLAFIPKIFTIAYDLQGRIINSDVISKVILGIKEDSESPLSTRGSEFSADVFSLFYNLNTDACPLTETGEIDGSKLNADDEAKCKLGKTTVETNLELLRGGWTDSPLTANLMGPISALTQNFGLNLVVTANDVDGDGEKDAETGYVINFSGLLALCVGGFILWTLIVYGVEVAKRYFQLIYLQIIAPIAIISYLSPKKDGVFSKWTKQCITTYLDLFIRLSIINFILLIIDLLHDSFFNTSNLLNAFVADFGITPRMDVLMWVYIFLIFGLFTFAKKAPKMLSELFPSSGAAAGGFGLGMKDGAGQSIRKLGGAGLGIAAIAGQGIASGIKQGRRRGGIGKDGKPLDAKESRKGAIWGGIRGGLTGAYRGATSGYKDGNFLKNIKEGVDKQSDSSREFGNRMENGYGFQEQMSDRFRSMTGQKSRISEQETKKAPIKRQSDMYDKIFQANKSMRDEAKKHVVEEGAGRYSGEYKAALTKVRDLKEDSAVRAEFTVGKYATQTEADIAYNEAVQEARESVNKQNYINVSNGNVEFDQVAYEAACDRAARKVSKESFDSQISRYATQAEADEAYRAALAQADAELDAAEKKAINDYIDNGAWDATSGTYGDKDKKIQQIQQELFADIIAYNSNEQPIDQVDKIEIDQATGEYIVTETHIDPSGNITYTTERMNAKAFHNYAKAQAEKKSENARRITAIDAEIERIKRQTEGSGIKLNDNK